MKKYTFKYQDKAMIRSEILSKHNLMSNFESNENYENLISELASRLDFYEEIIEGLIEEGILQEG